jgi:hypothetical protein
MQLQQSAVFRYMREQPEAMKDVLRRGAHTAEELAAFHRDGFVVFPGIMHDEAAARFREELLSIEQSRDAGGPCEVSAAAYLAMSPDQRAAARTREQRAAARDSVGPHQFGPASNRSGVQGAHLNPLGLFILMTPLGLFLRSTSIPFI